MYPLEKYRYYYAKKINADGTTCPQVIAVSTFAGRVVRGIATCDPRDEKNYDIEKGKALAAARCNEKIAARRVKRAQRKHEEAEIAMAAAIFKYNDTQDYVKNSIKEFDDAKKHTQQILDSFK